MTPRRVFLGSLVAASASGVAVSSFIPAQLAAQQRPPKVAPENDAILTEIRRQLELAGREAQRTPKAGTWQRGSSALLMFAAWCQTNGIDKQLQAAIRQRGATALAYQMTQFRPEKELKHLGLTLPAPVTAGTLDDYERAINGILKQGLGPVLRSQAALLSAAEQRGAGRVGVARIQLTPEQQEGCRRFKEQILWAEVSWMLLCIAGPWFCGIVGFQYFLAQIAGYYYWQGLC